MKSEKYSKIYSLIISNLNTVLQSKKAEDLVNGIDDFLIEENDLPILQKMYSVQTTEEDSVSLLTMLALNAKLAKFALETNAADAFEVLRRQREWHILYHCFTEVMPDEQQYKQCFPVQRMIFDADYCSRMMLFIMAILLVLRAFTSSTTSKTTTKNLKRRGKTE